MSLAASNTASSFCDDSHTSPHTEGGDKTRSQSQQNETDAGVEPSEVGFRGKPRRGHTLLGDDRRVRQRTRRRSVIQHTCSVDSLHGHWPSIPITNHLPSVQVM